jgi:type IV pilus assembly protein PilW
MKTLQRQPAGPNRQSGFSLVELMVAITLGLLLIAGMLQLFQGSRVTFNTNDALARVQENGRFALETLKRELRQAGTHGFCGAQLEIENHLNASCSGVPNSLFDDRTSLVGWEFDGTGGGEDYTIPASLDPATATAGSWSTSIDSGAGIPTALQGEVVPGSDILVVRRLRPIADVVGSHVTAAGTSTTAEDIDLTTAHGLEDDSLVLVTNCANAADLFQNLTGPGSTEFSKDGGSCASPGPGNDTSVGWSTTYDASMQAFQVVLTAYYVGADDEGTPGLYRLDLTNGTAAAAREELVRGVESMQVQYGFSRAAPQGDGQSVNDWVDADAVPADGWQQVLGLRIGLSMRSDESADLDRTQQTFELAGANVQSQGDGRIRQPFTSTIALRNRVLVF